jgi:hypothetical protein
MNENDASNWPDFRDWSIAAVHLLRGVVYADDARVWDIVLASQGNLALYLSRLGLLLVVDEAEGFAYVRQVEGEELPEGYERLPKLIHKTRLGYDSTLLCILLREELRRFEEEEVHDQRCVVEATPLFDQWKGFFPTQQDEVVSRRHLAAALRKLEEFGFVKKFSDEPESWEIRRILKARLPVAQLENLKTQFVAATTRGDGADTPSESDA